VRSCAFAIHYRNCAQVLIEVDRLAEAEKDIRTAEALEPDHPYIHVRRGYLAYCRGNDSEALGCFRDAAGALSDPTDLNFDLALPLLRLRRGDEALTLIDERIRVGTSANELASMLQYLNRLQQEQPDLPLINDAVMRIETKRSSLTREPPA